MSQVEIARFADLYEADLAAAFLTSRGLGASVADRHLSTIDPLMQRALGGIRVMTPEQHADAARDMLARAARGEFATDGGEAPDPASGGRTLTAGVLAAFFLTGGYGALALTAGGRPVTAVRVAGLVVIAILGVAPLAALAWFALSGR